MDKWCFRVRKRDDLSLESRDGRDGGDLAHGELGHGGMLEVRGSVIYDTSALAVYTHFPFPVSSIPGIAEVPTLQLPLPHAGENKTSPADTRTF